MWKLHIYIIHVHEEYSSLRKESLNSDCQQICVALHKDNRYITTKATITIPVYVYTHKSYKYICVPVPTQDLDCQQYMLWSFDVQWVKARGDWLFCWYWWNWWQSLLKLSFHIFFGIVLVIKKIIIYRWLLLKEKYRLINLVIFKCCYFFHHLLFCVIIVVFFFLLILIKLFWITAHLSKYVLNNNGFQIFSFYGRIMLLLSFILLPHPWRNG